MTFLDLLGAETAELDAAVEGLSENEWRRVTAFKDWRVFDHIHHLNFSDTSATAAVVDPDGFRARRRIPRPGSRINSLGPNGPPDIPPAELLARWRAGVEKLDSALTALPSGARIPWYGPDMSVRAFVAARLMETWAHGQTIHDALLKRRTPTDRLRPICELGYRTLGWTFQGRGLKPPAEPVTVRLDSPSGGVWSWGSEDAPNRVTGPAEDFALVVCQCRNFADTQLVAEGAGAKAWMAIAQCFAGPPADPPAPGVRVPRYGVSDGR